MACPLLNLPSELLSHIITYINDPSTSRSLAQTCSRMQPLAESSLYHTVFHRSGEAATRLAQAILSLPQRARYIHEIDSRCKWQKRWGLESLAPVIAQATELRVLTIESPYCTNAYGKEGVRWREVMYALFKPVCGFTLDRQLGSCIRLQELTLHLSGSERYWSIDEELSAIFLHPTLRGLTISCAELHQDALRWLQGTVRTPLRKLELIECNLTVEALDTLLSLPRALEELTTGENCFHTWYNSAQLARSGNRYTNRLCSTHPTAFFAALNHQSHSLKALAYHVKGPSLSHPAQLPKTTQGLSRMAALTHITLDGYCPFFEAALTSPLTAPPALRSLEAKGDMFRLQCQPGLSLAEDYKHQISYTLAATLASPKLEVVDIISNRTFTNVSRNHRDAVAELGRVFWERGGKMKLAKRSYHRNIPPFLFGESKPSEEGVYDNEIGFVEEMKGCGGGAGSDIYF